LISLIKVVLREIRIQDFQGDYLPMETLLAEFPASDYAVVDVKSRFHSLTGSEQFDKSTKRIREEPS
jgi:hypothetical protein